jgi:hypothetical protein
MQRRRLALGTDLSCAGFTQRRVGASLAPGVAADVGAPYPFRDMHKMEPPYVACHRVPIFRELRTRRNVSLPSRLLSLTALHPQPYTYARK